VEKMDWKMEPEKRSMTGKTTGLDEKARLIVVRFCRFPVLLFAP